MNPTIKRLSRLYALLTGLYPFGFRQEFASEMQSVFYEKLVASGKVSNWFFWCEFWTELRVLPVAVLTEYRFAFREIFGRGIMSFITEDKSWRIEDRREAIIVSLPPLLIGICITLGALTSQGDYGHLGKIDIGP